MKNVLKGKWAFDTNLLIYALDKDSPYFKKVFDLFNLIEKGQVKPIVSSQNITEAINVLISIYNLGPKKAVQLVKEIIINFGFKIITPLPSTVPLFFSLFKKRKARKSVYDIFLAATLIDNKQLYLLTNNEKDFQGIDKLTIVNPLKQGK